MFVDGQLFCRVGVIGPSFVVDSGTSHNVCSRITEKYGLAQIYFLNPLPYKYVDYTGWQIEIKLECN